MLATVKNLAARAESAMRRTSKARTRTLDSAEIAEGIRRHLTLARREPESHVVVTTLRGGYVPNSYGYRAEADAVVITSGGGSGARVGLLTVEAHRTWAQSRARGKGPWRTTRSRAPGQSQGRIVESA